MNAIIDFLNTIFWGYVLIYGLLAVGRLLHHPARASSRSCISARCSG